jgi:hypothetical protein
MCQSLDTRWHMAYLGIDIKFYNNLNTCEINAEIIETVTLFELDKHACNTN